MKFRVESQQMPEFYTSQKNQESHEISQCDIYDRCIMETGEPVGQEKRFLPCPVHPSIRKVNLCSHQNDLLTGPCGFGSIPCLCLPALFS